jgi:dolichol-phosphate mannosyltransferase
MVTVVLPTYNEAENLPRLVPLIHEALDGRQYEILVMDDGSPDGTADVAERLSHSYPIRGVRRTGRRGLAHAVLEGFQLARGTIAIVMDADLSHPPEMLPELIAPIQAGRAEIVVGTRNLRGGGSEGWPLRRRVISGVAGLMAKPLTRLSDPTTGFMAVRLASLEGVHLRATSWKIVLETAVKVRGRLVEVPFIFRDRSLGKSKLGLRQQRNYLVHLGELYAYRFLRMGRRGGQR